MRATVPVPANAARRVVEVLRLLPAWLQRILNRGCGSVAGSGESQAHNACCRSFLASAPASRN